MKPILDKSMFRDATTDSGSLSVMSSIVHRITEPGEYYGIIYRETEKAGSFQLRVCGGSEPPEGGEKGPVQANIDLVSLTPPCGSTGGYPTLFLLQTGGFLIFSVPTGSGEFAVELFCTGKKKKPEMVFDSRRLSSGDIFLTHVLRPGTYSVRDSLGHGQADLTVSYPEPGKTVCRVQPVLVECKEGSINPGKIQILPAQALMFSCFRECRITIELKKADDRPRPPRSRVFAQAAGKRKKRAEKHATKGFMRKIRFAG